MSVAEIEKTKSDLKEWIEHLSDINMLSILDSLRISQSDNDWWDELTESQRTRLNDGLADVKNNQTMTSAEFWDKLKNGSDL